MSDLSRHRNYLVWGVVALGLSVILTLILVPAGTVVMDQRRSMARTTPDGAAGWARSLEVLGVDVEPRYSDLDTQPPGGGGLVLLEPLIGLSAREIHRLLEFVRSGGTVVLAPGFLTSLGDSIPFEFVTNPAPDPYGFTTYRDSLVEHRWTEAPRGWATSRTLRLEVDPKLVDDWEPLTEGELDGVSMGWMELGDGGILLLATAGELSNAALASSPLAPTATRAVIDLLGDQTLYFSEYHQGMGASRGLVREAIGLTSAIPFGRVFLHLVLTTAFLVILAGRRFGDPLPPPPAPRRSTVEHVHAVAHIFHAARSDRTVAGHLVRAAARRAGLPMGGESVEELLQKWSRRPDLSEPAGAALSALVADPPDLLTLESALDDVVERHLSARAVT